MYRNQNRKGFSLVEMLIVIAIIGILATVVINPLSKARTSAQRAKTLASLRSAQNVGTVCIERQANLNAPNIANPICAGQNNWPAPVGDGWVYGDAGACAFDGDVSDATFTFCASDGVQVIACTDSGCNVL